MSSNLIFVTGRQRSGTTVFRRLLAKNGALDADDIFHCTIDRRYSFFGFLYNEISRDPSIVYPMQHPSVFHKFISFLESEAAGKPIVLDVKYYAYSFLSASYILGDSKSFIVEYMKRRRSHVFHIQRRNRLRSHISEMIALETGAWTAVTPAELPAKPKVRLDTDKLIGVLHQMVAQNIIATTILRGITELHTFDYEDMFADDGRYSDNVCQAVGRAMGISEVDGSPNTIKMNPGPIADLVSNYEEVVGVLKGTEFEWMLNE